MLWGQLEAFVEAARHGSVSRAATALSISQPALTARLKALEQDLGVQLLVRTARGVELSHAGQEFLGYAQRALNAMHEGRQILARLREGKAGHLSLATAPALSAYVLPPILKGFRQAHPNVKVTIRTGHPKEVIQLVLLNEAELGLGCDITDERLTTVDLYQDELGLVVAPEHPAAGSGFTGLQDLRRDQLIVLKASGFENVVGELLRDHTDDDQAVLEVDSIDAAKHMVQHGIGVAILPYIAVKEDLEIGHLAWATLREMGRLQRRIVAFRRRDAGRPFGAVDLFLEASRRFGAPDPRRFGDDPGPKRGATTIAGAVG